MSDFSVLGEYPGRGVVVRRSASGPIEWAYFVTGRSEASRRRTVQLQPSTALIASTEQAQRDPLRHYACAQTFVDGLIIGNGDHVTAIAMLLDSGAGLTTALEAIDPEPDPPINTPRIGARITESSATMFSVALRGGTTARTVTEPAADPQVVTVQTTYAGDGHAPIGTAPLTQITCSLPFDRLVDELWASLAEDRRVLLLAGVGPSTAGCWSIRQDL